MMHRTHTVPKQPGGPGPLTPQGWDPHMHATPTPGHGNAAARSRWGLISRFGSRGRQGPDTWQSTSHRLGGSGGSTATQGVETEDLLHLTSQR